MYSSTHQLVLKLTLFSMGHPSKFVLLGAGLPRNGTMSTRAALKQLLGGDVYHMITLAQERPDHYPLWKQALDKTITEYT